MRIAIVGGGIAGLTTAWLLQHDHEVMLFERQAKLGGHAQTIEVEHGGQTIAIDVAAEFFGNRRSYPRFHRLLDLLDVPTRRFAATATVFGADGGRKLVLPPWRRGTVDRLALSPAGIADLLRFAGFSAAVGKAREAELRQQTIGDFLGRTASDGFRRDLLEPFLIGQFGMPRLAFDSCLAYDILKYCGLAAPLRLSAPIMTEVPGGTRTYITALAKALGPRCVIPNTAVDGIESEAGQLAIIAATGARFSADHVVLAVGVAEIGRLYPRCPLADAIRTAAAGVDTFEAELAIHGDEALMPADPNSWSVANFRRTAHGGALTVWKSWLSRAPLFRSWVTGEHLALQPDYGRFKFRHPIGNAKYYGAQKKLRALQGQNNVWFVGSYVHDNDCHESAVASAIAVAQALAPRAERVMALAAG